jgi:arylsulfatase A-like enzyme
VSERRWTLLLVALALTLPIGALVQPWLAPSRSNMPAVPRRLDAPVILITVAGLRADRLHHLGYERPTTPNLDRLAELGVSFTGFYANANRAIPALAALLAARCPAATSVLEPGAGLPGALDTLGEQFQQAGYDTLAVVAHPDLAGRGFGQGFRRFVERPGAPAEAVLGEALALLDEAPSNRYLLWIDLADLRPPFGGPELDLSAFAPDAPSGFGSDVGPDGLSESDRKARGWGERELGWMSSRYDAALARLDGHLGSFLESLGDAGRLETLMLTIVGSAGLKLDDRPGRMFAEGLDLYDHSIRVPFLVRLPARHVRGLQLDRLGQSVDVGPTLADLGGRFEWQGTAMGLSLDPAIRLRQAPNKVVFSQGPVRSAAGQGGWEGWVLRLPTHKYITDAARSRKEIFRIDQDPGERSPLPLAPVQVQIIEERGGEWWRLCGPP